MQSRPLPPLRVVTDRAGSYIPASDAEIIDAFARGDRRAAALVYDRLLVAVDSTLYRVIGRREADHDDLVQAAFEQIIITLTRRRFAGGCTLHGWAAAITCNVALNAIRSRRRSRRVFDTDAEAESRGGRAHHDVEAQVSARRELERLRGHLAAMDPDRAQTVLLHDVFGTSLAETAKLTGVSMTAAQSRLARGRKDLRERMIREDAE